MNIGKGEVVSILIPRCNYMVTASLGVLKSGAAYQPLDPTYPAERLNFMMKDADCRLLIADEALLEKVSDYKGPVLLTKDIPGLKDSGKLEKNPSPEDLFILLYTSGSTGTPKGVMLEHGSIANFCYWYRNYYNLDENSRVAAYASYGFDANMMDMYPALTNGACVCIIDEEMRLDLMAMEEWFNKLNITHSFITTQVGRQFYTTANTTSLKYLSVGGEKLVPVQPLDKADKKPVLYNGYGPTECTIFSTITPVNRIYNRVPIGTPLSNYKCYVVDANMRRLPPLVPGELLISGRGVSRGYLNRPDLTQKVFIANPFSSEKDYIRAYHTGDIVRLLPDGKIDFIGRNDGQVKVRGFRVELSEIEAVIREFPGIKDATVAAFDNPAGGKFIAAYVVSHDSIDKDALRKFIGERKPPYMIPSAIMQLDKIPLNQNSKVNRKALPLPTLSSDREKKAPANDIQRQIMGIVKEALGHDDFGVDTDLYEAGLTSITSIRLSVLIGRAFNRVMKTSDLKGNSTVEKLETFMTGSKSTENPEHEILQSYPLSASQQGVFIDTIANNGTTIYNIPFLFHLGDEIDINRLHEALKKVIEAHPYLKVRLSMNEDGEIHQIRDDTSALNISVLNTFEPEKLLSPFDVLKENLARFSIHDSPQGKYLFMDLHHLIADGTSIMILLEDLDRAYSGELLEGETYSAYDAALDGETAEQGEAHNQAAKFFDNIFSECGGSTDIPYDLQGGSPSAGTFSVNGTDTREEVKQFCNKLGITENVFFLGAFGIALSRETGKTKPVFTTIYNGRNDSRLARTVGMLVKTLPVMCDTALPTGEYFRTLQSQLLGMMDNDIYSFSEISSAYSIEPNTMIDFRGDAFSVKSVCGQEAEQIFLPLNAAKTPLSISIDGNKNGYRYEMEYRSDLYSNEKMKQVMYLFSKTVNELISGKNPSELSATESPITGSAWEEPFISVTERFERQAEINPNHIAVICCNEKYSFAELNNRANKIAHSLIKHGVRKENIVAVMLHRCIDVYASRQAVLKAGGAFLCIAPDYPDDRVRFILEDAGVKVIITSEHIRKERSSLFESAGCSAFTVNELADNPNSDNPGLEINEHDLCYCIYTSGSTGKP
ncbi:MAG: amino acid adenylation domain-containing protein, partial [Synergistaceae bacterium]|nr:amino acid adenylation domain-containing protein [Synergistaceae bacterium]